MAKGAPDWTTSTLGASVEDGVLITGVPAVAFWKGKTKSYEDTSFVEADSPKTLDVYTDLGRHGHAGYIVNDGAGDIIVEIEDPDAGWGGQHTLEEDEVFDLYMLDIKQIRLTWVANSAYRVMVV
jgi:hypothetical protein